MALVNRCFDYLVRNGVRYSHSIHPPAQTARAVADAERMPAHELAKTVVYFGDNGFGMAVLPADHVVDFGELARLLGLSYIRLATEQELLELFPGAEPGSMPPFGQLFDLPVLIDTAMADQEFIAFSAGTHRDVIRISVEDFQHLVKPLCGRFSMPEPVCV